MRLRYLLICVLFHSAFCSTTTERIEIFTAEYMGEELDAFAIVENVGEPAKPHKSISEIVNEQTEAIRKIIKNEQEFYSANKLQPQAIIQEQNEDKSFEELRKKCQDLSKDVQQKKQQIIATVGRTPGTIQTRVPQLVPEHQVAGNYVIFTQNPHVYAHRANKYSEEMDAEASSNLEKEELPETQQADGTDTSEPIGSTIEGPQSSMKYVRLDPLTLQHIHLLNGQTIPTWYRLLPTIQTFIQIPDIPANEEIFAVAEPPLFDAIKTPLPQQYKLYLDPITRQILNNSALAEGTEAPGDIKPEHMQTPPQFYFNPQTGMIYQSGLSHQFVYHNRPEYTGTLLRPELHATPTTSTTTTTTEAPMLIPNYSVEISEEPEKPIEDKYKHQFRFVIPMIVRSTEEQVSKYPDTFDPYAYYPKEQQPELMNVPLPYVPNYHIIQALTIPSKLDKSV